MFQFDTILQQPVKLWNANGTKCDRITYLHRFRVCSRLYVDENPFVVSKRLAKHLFQLKFGTQRLILPVRV